MNSDSFLAIDESNYGRVPEYYVGVYSLDPNSIIELLEPLEKVRSKRNHKPSLRDYLSILQQYNFKYISIGPDEKLLFSPWQLELIIYNELLRTFNPSRVYIDGDKRFSFRRNLKKIKPGKYEIFLGSGLDTRNLLVNNADLIANTLFHIFKDLKENNPNDCISLRKLLLDRRLSVNFSSYSYLSERRSR